MTRTLSLFLLITILLTIAAPAVAAPTNNDTTYVVRSGDTLFSIARKFGVTVAAIARANGITNTSLIFVGQRLVIPGAGTSSSGSTGGNTGAASSAGPCPRTYIVQRGETLRRRSSKRPVRGSWSTRETASASISSRVASRMSSRIVSSERLVVIASEIL